MSLEEIMSVIKPGEHLTAKQIVTRAVNRYGANPRTLSGDVSHAVKVHILEKSTDTTPVYWIAEEGDV